jgi:hypothetical protein
MNLCSVRGEGHATWRVVRDDEFMDVGNVMAHRYNELKAAIATV